MEITIQTKDNTLLKAHLFSPEESNHKVLLINSATGVKQQVYFKFAQYLSTKGYTVITYDYRGIGLSKPHSMKNYSATMRDWGSLDYRALCEFIFEKFPQHQKYLLGHSVGALILGMNPYSQFFEKFIFIATQNAYIGNLKWKTKIEASLGFGVAQPLFSKIFGYFPSSWFGLGESLPTGCAKDWKSLIMNKSSINKLLESTENFSPLLQQETIILHADDDNWVTLQGIDNLLKNTYPQLKSSLQILQSSESPHQKIGHINFFRSYNQSLWKKIVLILQ
ncbi:alpha/beta fold hydrolase [Elizabethkingia sp. JS20170427COW]|uniref:alpha/beta hydrolase family protein n=1 Tax=Elizabethkingia sp. JS20170427COW TaxID=2583851 RepID=UPI0011102BF9|nr:alpha/beta fold hydrolase [Elizabethkingia sp. JS20170427COW]QCX52771.1 alpha/beta fold hydrolase [Elizabethkingia sp. JS20170427COW]